jgi:ubiquinone/menaquinone biosynthesis C-methylase UbiE
VLTRIISAIHDRPSSRRALWRHWYQYLAGKHRDRGWRYMNYGFAGAEGPPFPLPPEDEADRTWLALYHHVAGAVDLRGRAVLEVGSGRGGGAAFLKRQLDAASVVGVDLSDRAVAFCREVYDDVPGLAFQAGDAEALPFEDARFDAVVNVESSHCYGSLPRFLGEVRRVLRPGGHFLYADFRLRRDVEGWRAQVHAAGMAVERERDITANVLRAIEEDSDRRLRLVGAVFPRLLAPVLKQFAAAPGSRLHHEFRSGGLTYLSFVLRR